MCGIETENNGPTCGLSLHLLSKLSGREEEENEEGIEKEIAVYKNLGSDMPFSTSKTDSLEGVNNRSFELYQLTETIKEQVKRPEQIVQFSHNLVNMQITNWHVND